MLCLLGYAYGGAGNGDATSEGPKCLKVSPILRKADLSYQWRSFILGDNWSIGPEALGEVESVSIRLAKLVAKQCTSEQSFCVIGGDHSSAIGTWHGVADVHESPFALIWVDAHLDAHTPDTSHTGNIHGMPLAALLGYGADGLVHLLGRDKPVLEGKHVHVIGVRSYEDEEKALLDRLGVHFYDMNMIKKKGLAAVWQGMMKTIQSQVSHYGVSIDLDAFDPKAMPGVAVEESGGIDPQEFLPLIEGLAHDRACRGLEIVEFVPEKDQDQKTESWIVRCLEAYARRTENPVL